MSQHQRHMGYCSGGHFHGQTGMEALRVDTRLALRRHAPCLDRQRGDDALRVDQGRLAQVVEAAVAEDLGAGLEPHRLLERRLAAGLQQLPDSTQAVKNAGSCGQQTHAGWTAALITVTSNAAAVSGCLRHAFPHGVGLAVHPGIFQGALHLC